ncbi:MAG: creatininase family protein [Planctomycetota bacterium]|jgi:creatinine amidohydrolase
MKWEELTAPDFARAVDEAKGVCVVATGVLEKHGEHLPVGTDVMNSHRLCVLAAEREPAVVFPQWYFGKIYEAKHQPGCVAVGPELLLKLFEEVIGEIARNGLRKIILYLGHGGNKHLLPFVAQCTQHERRDYLVYVKSYELTGDRARAWGEIVETQVHGHACECETSISLANHPDLVKMDAVPGDPALPMKRLEVPGAYTAVSWYADHPGHYCGDARPATAEKGRKLRELMVEDLAEFIRAVKADRAGPALLSEFYDRVDAGPGESSPT